jgi:hypothetical protein
MKKFAIELKPGDYVFGQGDVAFVNNYEPGYVLVTYERNHITFIRQYLEEDVVELRTYWQSPEGTRIIQILAILVVVIFFFIYILALVTL